VIQVNVPGLAEPKNKTKGSSSLMEMRIVFSIQERWGMLSCVLMKRAEGHECKQYINRNVCQLLQFYMLKKQCRVDSTLVRARVSPKGLILHFQLSTSASMVFGCIPMFTYIQLHDLRVSTVRRTCPGWSCAYLDAQSEARGRYRPATPSFSLAGRYRALCRSYGDISLHHPISKMYLAMRPRESQ
jgi:hypothetical protein